jgi:hypothetical protein
MSTRSGWSRRVEDLRPGDVHESQLGQLVASAQHWWPTVLMQEAGHHDAIRPHLVALSSWIRQASALTAAAS